MSHAKIPLSFSLLLTLLAAGCKGEADERECNGGCEYQLEMLDHATLPPSAVHVFFALTTCDGEGAPGFDGEDFVVYENGEEVSSFEGKQEIVPSYRGYGIATALLLDLSGSIVDSGNLEILREAAGVFLESVGGGHEVGIYGFDGREELQELVAFTDDYYALEAGMAALNDYEVVDNSTNLNGAVLSGLQLLAEHEANSDVSMFMGSLAVFTDGSDQAGRVSDTEASQAVSGSEHAVYAIGLAGEVDEQHLLTIGKDGSWTASSMDGLGAAFESVADSINDMVNSLYILAYCSPKRTGVNTLLIELAGSETTGQVEFDADGFEGGCEPDDFLPEYR